MNEQQTIPLILTVINTKRKSTHKCPCEIPSDILNMTEDQIHKAYGKHLSQALYDLIQHKAFRQGLEKTNLILAP